MENITGNKPNVINFCSLVLRVLRKCSLFTIDNNVIT